LLVLVAAHAGVAAFTVGLSLALTLPLRDELSPGVWGLFYGAVLVSAYLVGPIAALLATAIALPLGVYFLVRPFEETSVENSNDWLPAILFVIVSVLIAGIDWYRRRAEAARDASERRYGQVFEGAGISLWREDFSDVFTILAQIRSRGVKDIDVYLEENPEIVERAILAVRIQDVNTYTVELFGASNKRDMLDSLAGVFTPESREAFKRELAVLYNGGRFVQDEIVLRRLNGEEFIALFTVTVLGAPPSADVLVSVLDISARHAAENALKHQQERLELALSAGSMGPFEWDIATQTIRWGAEIEALRGGDPDTDYEGSITEFLEMVHPEDRERLQLAVTETLQAGAADLDIEYRATSTAGEIIWFAAKGRVQRDAAGQPVRISGVAWDISRRKQYELSLQESEERARFLAETSAILGSSLDYSVSLDRIVRSVVPVFADFCVVDLLGSDGRFERMAMAYHDESREAKLWDVLKQRPPGPESGHLVMRAVAERTHQLAEVEDPGELVQALAQDDEHRAALSEIAPRRMLVIPMVSTGRAIGTMTLMNAHPAGRFAEHDIGTLEALAERAALAVENAQLYARAQEVLEELRKANMVKDEFLGMVSHELRTPVTTMYSGAKLLLARYDDLDDAVKRDVIRDVQSESERLQMIIENLLALARQEMGWRVQPEPVVVTRTVQSAARRLEKMRPDRAVKIECCGQQHYVACVPIYLDLVLRNVMDNADKYSPRHQPIEVSTENRNGNVAIVIRDYGPGIADAEREKIYERFYRSAGTASTTSGAGIGLAVCRRLMESQGGTIESRNADGGGLEVTLTLPAVN
jgi:signal transduction histidine kinase/PAS domain-containing protein